MRSEYDYWSAETYDVYIESPTAVSLFDVFDTRKEAIETVDYYGGRWYDENGHEWKMFFNDPESPDYRDFNAE